MITGHLNVHTENFTKETNMNKQIRQGVFETNSSSTHTISIAKSNEFSRYVPTHTVIFFSSGQFGWENEVYHSSKNKAAYLWTGIVTSGIFDAEAIEKIKNSITRILERYECMVCFQPYKVGKYETCDREYTEFADANGYIDHSDELSEFLRAMFPDNEGTIDEALFLNYLFNPYSYIETSNDNSDEECYGYYPSDNNIHGERIEFYKGN